MQVEVKIMSVELYENSDSVVLNVEDKFGHSLTIELDEINVSKSLLDDAWSDGWSDYDTDVDGIIIAQASLLSLCSAHRHCCDDYAEKLSRQIRCSSDELI